MREIISLEKETEALRRSLVNRTIKDVECHYCRSGDCFIKIKTDKGSVIIGANDLGVRIATAEEMRYG